MLTIVLLLSNFMNLLANNNLISYIKYYEIVDTSIVNIPICLIKKSNAKMIERLYLIKINNEQDSIINLKDKYIKEQYKIITDFKQQIEYNNKINKSIKKDLESQKRKTKIIGYSCIGSVIILLTTLIIK